jgi:hypothetical protein
MGGRADRLADDVKSIAMGCAALLALPLSAQQTPPQ